MSIITVHFTSRATTVRFPASSTSTAQFAALEAAYIAALPEFVSNEAARVTLSPGAEYRAAAGHYAAPRGSRLIAI